MGTQEEHDYFHHEAVETYPSMVHVMPLWLEDFQAQRDTAQDAGHHTRILRAHPSWQDRYRRIGKRAAEDLAWRVIQNGIGTARGFFTDMMAVWSLFSELRR